jgi:outer membrane protein assembly factor BamB
VFEDTNGDGLPSSGEHGVAGVVVAYGVTVFGTTDANGEYEIDIPSTPGIVWARVPDGFTPGPAFARVDDDGKDADIALRRSDRSAGPFTFVVGSDTHLYWPKPFTTGDDLAAAASFATALDPAPAFFTILGDITQGNKDEEFAIVDHALSGIDVPYVPVPGNHDWYDGGAAWFAHYGPDNYSFDIGSTHFVVWNMAMSETAIRTYLGAELSHVSPDMMVIAMTHAPPSDRVTDALRDLGVAYVLTGHAHTNRVVDHDGVIELNTEPMLMGGLDFTPAGYRVITITGGELSSYHRTFIDDPSLSVIWPRPDSCVPPTGSQLVVGVELDGSQAEVHGTLDCSTPIPTNAAGGWSFVGDLPELTPGSHSLTVVADSPLGGHLSTDVVFEVCDTPAPPPAGDDWNQLGGGPAHLGARATEVVPPLATRWVASVGGHVITAPPVIVAGVVYVAVSDLGDGSTSAVVALDLATGRRLWRSTLPHQIRGGVAVSGGVVTAPLLDGVVLGLDAATGEQLWEYDLSPGLSPEAAATYAPPAIEGGEAFIGNQRAAGALATATGDMVWMDDPVPDGRDSQSSAAFAVGDGIAVGTFQRAISGVIAWDSVTGERLWRVLDAATVAVNASPLIADGSVYFVSGADDVTAVGLDGQIRWRVRLDPDGFDWGNATIGTPALASGTLVVPTLYRDLVALDAATGTELWRFEGEKATLRVTHYRGADQSGFEASPVITGDIVWAVDTSGVLSALELRTGDVIWQTTLEGPVLAGLAISGDWLVAAGYDGTVRALVPVSELRSPDAAETCLDTTESGCCNTGRSPGSSTLLVVLVGVGLRRRRRGARARARSR